MDGISIFTEQLNFPDAVYVNLNTLDAGTIRNGCSYSVWGGSVCP